MNVNATKAPKSSQDECTMFSRKVDRIRIPNVAAMYKSNVCKGKKVKGKNKRAKVKGKGNKCMYEEFFRKRDRGMDRSEATGSKGKGKHVAMLQGKGNKRLRWLLPSHCHCRSISPSTAPTDFPPFHTNIIILMEFK